MNRTCHRPTLYFAPFKGRASARIAAQYFPLCNPRLRAGEGVRDGAGRGEFVALTWPTSRADTRDARVLLMERVYGTCITGAKVTGQTSFTSSSSLRAICCKAARECSYISRFGPEAPPGPPRERLIAQSVFLSPFLSLSLSLSLSLNFEGRGILNFACLYIISVCIRL